MQRVQHGIIRYEPWLERRPKRLATVTSKSNLSSKLENPIHRSERDRKAFTHCLLQHCPF